MRQNTYHPQTAKFLAKVCENMPMLPAEVMQGWIGNPKALQKVLREAFSPKRRLPAVGEIFELTLDSGDVDPMGMVWADSRHDSTYWQFNGPQVKGVQTRRFKLVQVGYCRDLDKVCEKLKRHGEVPEGQWREAFRRQYPEPDKNTLIGFAGSGWIHPDGSHRFPYLVERADTWFSYFEPSNGKFLEHWQWLVECK